MQSALTNAHKYDAIRRQVVTDHLTRLYNRRYFMNRAGEEIERSLRHQAPLSVLMVDIDHFKAFNDTYGHATGDRVLQTVARAMQDALRTQRHLRAARRRGVRRAAAQHAGRERLLRGRARAAHPAAARATPVSACRRKSNITISVGVATCPRDATDLDDLMELADKALYRAKAAGRDQVVLHGAEQRDRVRN